MSEGGATMVESILLYSEYDLIIDTNSESFSFYKQLCAYCTGFTNENEHALDYSNEFYLDMVIKDDESLKGKMAEEKNPFYGSIRYEIDNDIESPCAVMLNKRYGANEDNEYALLTEENCETYFDVAPLSVAILFDLEPTKEQIQIIKDRAVKFFTDVWPKLIKEKVEVEGFRLITRTHYGQEREI